MKKPDARKRKLLRKRRLAAKIDSIITGIAVIVLILCTAYLARGIWMHHRSNQIANDIRKMKPESLSSETNELNSHTPSFQESEWILSDIVSMIDVACAEEALPTEEPLIPVEFNEENFATVGNAETVNEEPVIQEMFSALYERNNDLAGWIYVNENIDYPIVWRDEDNDFYMNHDYDGNFSDDGWIFLDKRNELDMSDDQLLIYGHNMRAGTMFGELDKYREIDYLLEHPIIVIQSIYDEEPSKYVIISAFDASMNKDHSTYVKITKFKFETPEEKQDYINTICSRSIFDLPCDAMYSDQLVILVTCSYSHPNGRFLITARKLRDNETEEQIIEMYQNQN